MRSHCLAAVGPSLTALWSMGTRGCWFWYHGIRSWRVYWFDLANNSRMFRPHYLPRAQELEADEAAARALAHAGVPPEQWAAGLSLLTEDARAPEWRLEQQAEVSWPILHMLRCVQMTGVGCPAWGGVHASHDGSRWLASYIHFRFTFRSSSGRLGGAAEGAR